jgi:hypothetical protein
MAAMQGISGPWWCGAKMFQASCTGAPATDRPRMRTTIPPLEVPSGSNTLPAWCSTVASRGVRTR